tara:strand:- start:250 stop:834 length:585 start_codon:yes stop_codon:yes gene_type:complete
MNMKNAKNMLNEIKTLLGVEEQEIVLAQLNLENGTVLEAEDFKQGNDVFILTEDEKVALPVGEYELEDGRILEVAEEGVISEIKAEKEDDKDEEDEKSEDKEEMAYATKEELAEVVSMVEEIKSMIEKMGDHKEEKEEEKMSEEKELKENLSEASAEPIKHSPEKTTERNLNLYSQNRTPNTFDRVMEGIAQIK